MAWCCFGGGGAAKEGGSALKAARRQNFSGLDDNERLVWKRGQRVKVALLGLDDAGKTSVLHSLQRAARGEEGEAGSTGRGEDGDRIKLCAPPPTTEPQTSEVEVEGLRLSICDVPGRRTFRDSWMDKVVTSEGVVFVVDSTDAMRLPVVELELDKVRRATAEAEIPILLLATKQDISGSLSGEKVSTQLGVKTGVASGGMRDPLTYVGECSAADPAGVRAAFANFVQARMT